MNCFGCMKQSIPKIPSGFLSAPIPSRKLKGLREANSIGEGSFAAVCVGEYSGQEVALKRMKADCSEGSVNYLNFANEVNLLGRCDNPNVVKCYGYCIDKGNCIIVLEYCSNGTLRSRLHAPDVEQPLNWGSRIAIAVAVGRGVLYIHSLDPPIIHQDIKADNILLHASMEAKLADFGEAIILPSGQEHVETDVVKGTVGYMDPSCLSEGNVSRASDVYALGVVLLELAIGRAAVDINHYNGVNLAEWVIKEYNAKRILDLIDPLLGDSNQDPIIRFIHLAINYVQREKDRRPMISVVVDELLAIQALSSGQEVE